MTLKETLGNLMIDKRARFKCDCIFNIDVTGIIKSYKIIDNEIVFEVLNEETNNIIYITENHPKLDVFLL